MNTQWLEGNSKNRQGFLRRVVYLLSSNPLKLPEYRQVFDRYGIEVIRIPKTEDLSFIEKLLQSNIENTKVVAVLREESDLFSQTSGERKNTFLQAEAIINKTVLIAYTISQEALKTQSYEYETAGYVDLTRKISDGKNEVFGWDDLFVIDGLNRTYDELRRSGFKISSREMVLSRFLQDHIYYKDHVNLKYLPQNPKRSIDFALTVPRVAASTPLLQEPHFRKYKLDSLLQSIANKGTFFRAPLNRREKIYWLPGLNAGVPLSPKKDPIHEMTFLVHDLGHAAIPDLIFTGEASAASKKVYVVARMMSEALTLVMADMLYVDSLNQDGIQYDFSKRKIYPLFQATKLDFSNPKTFLKNLKTLMRANVDYCLRGSDLEYRRLIGNNPAGLTALNDFKNKYMPFFVEDFRWTEKNYDNMVRRQNEIQKWYQLAKGVSQELGAEFISIEEFAKNLNLRSGDLVDQVFEEIFETRIAPVFSNPVKPSPESRQLLNAFTRYMLGQLGLFARFGFAPDSMRFQNKLLESLRAGRNGMTLNQVQKTRDIYDSYVHYLQRLNLVSLDDAATYSEVYPLFDPFFVYYDGSKETYEDLSVIAKRILNQ